MTLKQNWLDYRSLKQNVRCCAELAPQRTGKPSLSRSTSKCGQVSPYYLLFLPFPWNQRISSKRQSCGDYPQGMLCGHLRVKSTASLLDLLLPWSYTGNNTTQNNTFKHRAQSVVRIHRSRCSQLFIKCIEIPLSTTINYQPVVNKTVKG